MEVHGESNGGGIRKATKEYTAWLGMRNRCRNPRCKRAPYYSERGITMCERWESYVAFLEDVGRAPSQSAQLDRIDNARGYEPGNVRWASKSLQMQNRRGWGAAPHKGVGRHGRGWRAYINLAGTRINLGTFDTIEEATAARVAGELRYFGFTTPDKERR